jgi:hypothetical protein
MKNLIVISVIVVLLIFSCNSSTDSSDQPETSVLMPLAIGNSWRYLEYQSSSPDKKSDFSLTVSDTFSVDNILLYKLTFNPHEKDEWLMYQDKSGLYLIDDGLNLSHYFKYPAENGETYNYYCPYSDSTFNFEVSINHMVVDSSSYLSYGYFNHNLHSLFPFLYFSPNIGLIKHKLIFYNNIATNDTSVMMLWDLTSYALN